MENQDVVYNYMDNEGENQHEENQEGDNNEEEIVKVYEIVDAIPLSRPKKNINRDFADGVLVAEFIKYFVPGIVELHNYPSSNNQKAKRENWNTLNRKVFRKLNFQLSSQDIEALINFTPGYIESVLLRILDSFAELGVDFQSKIYSTNKDYDDTQEMQPTVNKGKKDYMKYQQMEEEYKKQLLEKDEIIEGLKQAIEETERNLAISEENKKILNQQYEAIKKKIKEIGLY